MKARVLAICVLVLWGGALAIAACAHLPSYSVVPGSTPTPTPSAGPSSSPAACATQAPQATVIIVMSSSISATTVSPYNVINGYIKANIDSTFNNVASVINARSTDVIQFVNAENTGPATILHSAVGFPNAVGFPASPYSFPTSTQQQIGSAISQAQWSTGRLAPLPCFSQTLTASPGTYYFGDYDYYNLTNARDVLVVSS
ncbi:MAG TPA: hypothetical protein VN934_05830 [Candidatus Tumulicola sp.]|nr:hypothetical protein [Candidatus Tumulicola sp.]